ncbi:MAG: FlgD immunoglobulin-like domain containing protein, partial [Candidatus Cloacimonetes bacterium]|nr:FlgD immunoglobulin-like domain containing protein [Candidatus Cloacimonadota bacterium]
YELSPLRQKDAKISYYDCSFYLGWSNSVLVGSIYYLHIYGQRIQNGQKMWGPNGKVISVLPDNNQNNECTLYSLLDNYYIWHRVDPMAGNYTVWAKRVDAAGDATTGWPNDGMKASTHDNWDTVQYHPVAQQTPEGIFIMWKDSRDDYISNYWGQHISADGIRLWDPLGVNLADSEREQEQAAATVTSSGINFVWSESINGVHDISAQSFSFPGSPLWGSTGFFVVQKDSVQSHPAITSFLSGNSVVAWEDFYGDESDLYYKYISSSGTLSGETYGNPLTEAKKAQYQPTAITLNDHAYFVWADGRSSGKTEILGLFAQKLSNSVANIDDHSPALSTIELRQNHPNPFNPSTTISFALKNNSPALRLKIYNLKGQLVKTLFSGYLAKGVHSVVWDGKDNAGSNVSSGIYYYQINDGKSTQQRKMVLMK